jgi:hypothetical protein
MQPPEEEEEKIEPARKPAQESQLITPGGLLIPFDGSLIYSPDSIFFSLSFSLLLFFHRAERVDRSRHRLML